MKFFLDTASIDSITSWKSFGLVDGVTTNPTLLSKESNEPVKVLQEICKIVKGDVSAQVTYSDSKEMVEQANFLKSLSKNIVIKLPCTLDGIKASKILIKKNTKINITLGFDPAQLSIFRNLNIKYFSFIIGKVEDYGENNLIKLPFLKKIVKRLNPNIKLLLASIRNEKHLYESIISDAEVITVPPSTWEKVYNNLHTIRGEKDFFKAWKSLSKEKRSIYASKK